MTQKIRWLAALALLLAFSACTVRAEEEEEVAPPRPVVQILPPQGTPTALPYGYGCPVFPGTAWSLPCPYATPVAAFVPYGPPCAGCPACPAATCAQPQCPEPAIYTVALKLCKAGADGDCDVISSPRICMAEGQAGTVTMNGVATPKEQSSLRLNVTVTRQGGGALLDLAVEDAHTITGGEADVRTQTEAIEMRRHVALGGSTKMVLNENSDGTPRTWIEVAVTAVEQPQHAVRAACTGSCPGAKVGSVADAQEDSVDDFAECVQCVFDMVADTASGLFGGETWGEPVMPLAGDYLQQPPAYFPAVPAVPMARELSARMFCPQGYSGCGKVVTAHVVGECDCPSTGCGAGVCQCALLETVKQTGMHVVIDASHDRKCVEMTDGKKHFKASADQITVEGDCIDLQGDVRIESCDDSCNESTVIKADTVHLERKDGGLKVKIDE